MLPIPLQLPTFKSDETTDEEEVTVFKSKQDESIKRFYTKAKYIGYTWENV